MSSTLMSDGSSSLMRRRSVSGGRSAGASRCATWPSAWTPASVRPEPWISTGVPKACAAARCSSPWTVRAFAGSASRRRWTSSGVLVGTCPIVRSSPVPCTKTQRTPIEAACGRAWRRARGSPRRRRPSRRPAAPRSPARSGAALPRPAHRVPVVAAPGAAAGMLAAVCAGGVAPVVLVSRGSRGGAAPDVPPKSRARPASSVGSITIWF